MKKIAWNSDTVSPGMTQGLPTDGSIPILSINSDQEANEPMTFNVETVGNHIYFYNEINNETILRLNKALREVSNKLMANAIDNDIENLEIKLHINSDGGVLMDGFAGVDAIRNSRISITTIVDGFAASAATLLSVSGNNRIIGKHAYMMIHQLSSSFWGKHNEFQDEIKNLDKMMDMIKNLYKEFTKIPIKKINEIIKHDLYFDAKECLKYGLVDLIQ